MTTKTFKKGDTVRALASAHGFTKGNTYTVKTMTSYGGAMIEKDDQGRTHNGWNARFFELVTPAKTPIKAGDRVKCVRGAPGLSRYGAFGDTGTVNSTSLDGTILNVTLDKDKRTLNVNAERFEKIEEAPKVEPKFKAGDTVRALHDCSGSYTKGKTYTVKGFNGYTVHTTSDDKGRDYNGWYYGNFELVETLAAPEPVKTDLKTALGGEFTGAYRVNKPIKKAWIIAVLSNDGTPRPAEKPALYTSEAQAHAVAKSMAEKHTGETFMVFESTAVAAQPKTVSVELVRL